MDNTEEKTYCVEYLKEFSENVPTLKYVPKSVLEQ